ncbi:MAG: replicative DNA helicase [Waddliaceae bacterium]|nr:replicative DNA helicase [Waddliaceae bacterium]
MADEKKKVKVAPHSKESEMMVLGSMLTSVNSVNIAADSLDDSDFYFTEHKLVFNVIKNFYKNDKPIDVHLVCEELKRQEKLKAVGGAPYIMTLAQFAGTSAYIEEYVDLVRNKSILRSMINASQIIEKRALDEPDNVPTLLDEAQQLFYQVSQTAQSQTGTHIQDVLNGVKSKNQVPFLKELEERQKDYQERGPDDPGITGVRTHFNDLDTMLNGMGNSNLIILAARPAMGKTAFVLNLAENICFREGVPVGIFSLEMSAEQLVHRIICSQSEVESEKIKTGSLNGMEYQRIVSSVHNIQNATMLIDDQPGLKITDLRARARRMKETYGIGFLIIDYLQLIAGSSSSRSNESRQIEVSEISRMLKTLARELDIPILCCSQLSRKVEERAGHRPMMSDLRESGSIEQDADVVAFLLRREYYDPMDKPGQAEVIVGKNRHGAVGSVNLTFRKEIARFDNYTPLDDDFGDRVHMGDNDEAFAEFSEK